MTSDRTGLRESYPASWRWLRIARRIDGWLTDAEGNALFELARSRAPGQNAVVVELGSWQGKSSVLLAAGLCGKQNPGLFCVDPFGKDENPGYQQVYYEPLISSMRLSLEEAFRRNIRRCGLVQIVQPIKGYSFDAVRGWQKPIDLLFIDASHDYESVHRDLLLWSRFVKVNGVVILHDVSTSWEGPSRVMAEDLQPPYFGALEQVDSLLWATKTSADLLPEHRRLTITTVPKADFDARQREIARLLADRNRLDEKLRLAQAETSQLQAEIGQLEEKLRITERELAALRRSLTWRLTEPLRRWAGWLRDLGARSPGPDSQFSCRRTGRGRKKDRTGTGVAKSFCRSQMSRGRPGADERSI
jgi:predicted O-methyltransferase YrrM